MKKRIAILVDSLNGGGAERVCLTLTKTLIQMGHDAQLIVLKNKCDYEAPIEIPTHFLENDPSYRLHLSKNRRSLLNKFRFFLKNHASFDLIIANLDESHHLLASANIPNSLYVIHNSIEQSVKRSIKLGPIKYLRKLSAIKVLNKKNVVCVSEGLKNEIMESNRISPTSITTIYNPVDTSLIKKLANENLPQDISKPYCIHIGRFAKQKRHDVLFKAMQIDQTINMVLLTRKSKKLIKMIRKFELEDRITIREFIQNPYPLIKHAQALVLSSDFEGFGLVISEALACNTPVVSTDCPHGPSEQLFGSLKKYLVEKNDPQKLMETTKSAIDNKSDFFEVDVLNKFDPFIITQKYLDLIPKINQDQTCI